jgi:hypothetical protein
MMPASARAEAAETVSGMAGGAIAEGIMVTVGAAVGVVFFHVIGRSDTYIDIVTDQLARRRPGRDMDRRRLASWARATSLVCEGIGWIVVALGIASLVVGLL